MLQSHWMPNRTLNVNAALCTFCEQTIYRIQQWRRAKKWKMVTKTVNSKKKQPATTDYYSMAKWDENWITDFIYRIYRGQFISNRIRVNKCDNHKLCKMPRVHVHSFNVQCLCTHLVQIVYIQFDTHTNFIVDRRERRAHSAQVGKTFFIPSGLRITYTVYSIHCVQCIQNSKHSDHSDPMNIWFKLTRGWTN